MSSRTNEVSQKLQQLRLAFIDDLTRVDTLSELLVQLRFLRQARKGPGYERVLEETFDACESPEQMIAIIHEDAELENAIDQSIKVLEMIQILKG